MTDTHQRPVPAVAGGGRSWPARLRHALGQRHVRAVRHLLTGTAATVGLSLLSIALVARALGPAGYGVLALILALGQATERLVSFQSWQPLIRYGATLDPATDRDALRMLMKFGLLLDLAGSAIAWAVASLLACAAWWLSAMTSGTLLLTLGFLLSLLFNLNGVSTAVFRLYDRFRLSAQIQVANAALRLAACALAYAMGAGLREFVLVWTLTQIAGTLANFAAAWLVLRGHGIGGLLAAPLSGLSTRFPGLWRFAWGANLSLTLWSSVQQVDTLLVGWLADPAAAGLFHIAKRISRVAGQVGSQVEAVVYPDLSRLTGPADRRRFLRMIVQTELILMAFGGACFVAALLFADLAMRLTAGPRFAGAAPLLTVQILAVALTLSGAANRAGLLALGRQRAVMRTVMAATTLFYLLAPLLILRIGPMGANVAHVLFGTVWLGGLTIALRRALRAAPGAAG
jgi:O-antigen/teichoic acid export membrane protein